MCGRRCTGGEEEAEEELRARSSQAKSSQVTPSHLDVECGEEAEEELRVDEEARGHAAQL
jgi:hypothetical protein